MLECEWRVWREHTQFAHEINEATTLEINLFDFSVLMRSRIKKGFHYLEEGGTLI